MTLLKNITFLLIGLLAFSPAHASDQIREALYEDTYYESVNVRALASREGLDKGSLIFKNCATETDCPPLSFEYNESTYVELPNGKAASPKRLLDFSGNRADVAVHKKTNIIRQIILY